MSAALRQAHRHAIRRHRAAGSRPVLTGVNLLARHEVRQVEMRGAAASWSRRPSGVPGAVPVATLHGRRMQDRHAAPVRAGMADA